MFQSKVCISSTVLLVSVFVFSCFIPESHCSMFRGRVDIVDGRCNVTACEGGPTLLENGATCLMAQSCAKLVCHVKQEEFIGEGCWAIDCHEGCRPVAKDPKGTFPDCCLSNCDCSEAVTDFGR